ncbi:iron-sulfur cluster assembly scaffold protein [Candidatus Nomurabacteria bacterium]|uniref:Iron-sulfur cluster assembly scaffold protein n=1 Tax=candidate division WWE3 bacterium TaxID=2053526 RepID=A0A955E1K3_UNCKA|nr:iron-sulfur cluster assembly scaffold protein [candidate division WWE3 bacterium]MCB9823371.1 iron-sulfur cluster assembly scaffold protein [Candidatus Nomurabacteria bacterium]MCB9826736.1 iron-sulfur cluster assembly scaffold protein [Candidatus Nomurabacteria bacterium]MCB9827653.1 iron-sulfur cluster assembly scaffold protein [Candidatus Nomurabacteria bacterium]HXK52691.1 iron-sulfur cluster assembly scaffold protein [bacterium]
MADIYTREDLLEIYKNPMHRAKIKSPTVSTSVRNEMCGDSLDLELQFAEGKLIDAGFTGDSCAVSIIAASLVLDFLIGRSISEIRSFTKNDILDLLSIDLTTSRVKCATLILDALQVALQSYDKKD